MKNKTLLLIFLSLLAVFLITQFAFEKKTRSFKTELIQLDTASISSILIYPKSDNQEEMSLKKEGETWILSKGNVTTTANSGSVASLLRNLALIKTKRVASKSQEKWMDYEVEDGNGTRIKVYSGSTLLEDFIVGRFNFNQQTRQGISYVRLANGDEVYAVDGFLSMTMGQGFNAYRNNSISKINKDQVSQIAINTLGTTEVIQKAQNGWSLNGTLIDSTQMANYLTGLQSLNGATFVDDFDELQAQSLLYKTLSLEGDNMEPVIIKTYRDTSRTEAFVIQSSQNKDTYFSSDETGIYAKLFSELKEE